MSHEESDPTRPNDASSGRSPSPGQLSPEGLRQWAEAVLQRQPEEVRETPGEDIQDLIQTLHVHQVELEMQNEELRRTQWELERSRDRYADLYDFAPVAYLTVSETGMIMEANLTAAATLGVGRGQLIGQPLSRFVHERDQDAYYLHRRRLFEDREPQVWEMAMAREDGSPFWARVEARATEDSQGRTVCRASLSDGIEQRRAEEALRESEERYRTLFSSIGDAVFLTDAETGMIVDANHAALSLIGRTRDEALAMHRSQLHPPELEAEVRQTFADAEGFAKRGELVEAELRHADGHDIPVEIRTSLSLDINGQPCVIGVFRDITERKQAEAALRKTEKRHKDAERTAHLGSWEMDIATGDSIWSDEFFRICGYEPGSIEPSSEVGFQIIHPDDRDRAAEAINEAIETGEPYRIEKRIVRPDGTVRWVHSIGEITYHRQGEPKTLVGSFEDITERRRDEESLHEYRVAVEQSTDGIALGDMEGHIRFVNEAWAQMHGFSADETLGRHLSIFHTPEQMEKEVIPFNSSLMAVGSSRAEIGHARKDGTTFPAEMTSTVLRDANGNPLGLLATCRDITERKKAEEALRKSEMYSRTVIEAIPDIVIQTNVEGEYLDILTGSEDLLFLPREELLGRRMGDVLPEHTAQRMLDAVREALSTKKLRTVSYQLPVAAGNQYFEARIVPLRDEEALALIRDITERKRAEEALADSHQRLELALLGGELGMWDWNPQDGAVIYSDIWAEMLEYRPDEVEPTVEFFERHIHPEDLAAVLDRLTGHVEGRLPAYESEHRLRTKSGKWLWIMDRGKIVERDKDGSPLRVTGTIADITELKEAEQEREHLIAQIHGHAQQMEQVLNSVPTGMLLLDPHHRILLANSAARNDLTLLAGVGMGDRLTHLGERPLEDLLAPPPEGGWHELSADGRTFTVIARPTGEVDGEDAGWVVMLDDVTEQRQRQAHAERQGRLAAVGQLAGGIAHDFNNIMAVIILYAQTVARSEGLTERDREKMATIHQQGWHATRLIEQLLDFSRQATFEKRPLDLLPLLKEQVKLLERTLPEHIKIVLSHGEDECVVSADLTRMQQMIMNLAVNARDVMPEGGVLRLALERIAVEPGTAPPCPEMEAGEWVKLAISDTGTGIAPDVLQHLFEPFFTTKEPGAGTGLGLAQVHGIVAQHGGHIGVETEVGKGTTFAIYLSALAVRPAVPPTLGDSTVPQGRGEVVLVVEDNDAVRAAIVSSLEQMNYRALEAANGEQALAAMKEQGQQVALVLSDVVMPVMGGLELLRALRQEGGETPVILLSGHGVPPDRDELQAQGVMAWLGKPPSLEQLARAIASALSG